LYYKLSYTTIMANQVVDPPALDMTPWVDPNYHSWFSPTIAVPDRASLVKVLRLCGSDRFQEAYTFLLPHDYPPYCTELPIVLGEHTRQFAYNDTQRLRQVIQRTEMLCMQRPDRVVHTLVILECPSATWKRAEFFQELACNARHKRITLVLIEPSVQNILPPVRPSLDVFVTRSAAVSERERRKIHEEYFSCYGSLAAFTAAHTRERNRDAHLVWIHAGMHNDVANSVRSLGMHDNDTTRESFVLQPIHAMTLHHDMSTIDRDMALSTMRLGCDVHVTEAQALGLFRASGCKPTDFAASSHASAIATYVTWLEAASVDLLAITNTSYGHMPCVLCNIILLFL
jgi:hypothetical protein